MVLVMVTVGVCGLACWLVAAFVLPRLSRRPSSITAGQPRNPSREEDLVRPAVADSGARIWVEPEELIWHEIVAWPRPRAITPGRVSRRA
jgi:hypothetical protein